jgi:hypothetical protein
MEFADDYAFVNAGAVLDETGNVVDIVMAEGIGQSIEPVARWLVDGHRCWPQAPTVLLVSVRPFEVDVVREQDLLRYRHAGWAIAAAGGQLIDWIETDGDLFRSYAYVTCPGDAWPNDGPDQRHFDSLRW